MDIIQATKQSKEKGKCMRRAAWNGSIKIRPTDICYDIIMNEERRRFWDAKANDVLADDWCVVD